MEFTWVDVKKALPNKTMKCLIATEDGVVMARYDKKQKKFFGWDVVMNNTIAWAEIPPYNNYPV